MESNIEIYCTDEELCFVGTDVTKALGYTNPRKDLKNHVDKDDVTKRYPIVDSLGRIQKVSIINESGLYSLILASKLPAAKKFKHWITSEVLPAIRKTGSYNPNPPKIADKQTVSVHIGTITVENLYLSARKEESSMEEKKKQVSPKSDNRRKIGERTHIYRNPDGSIFGKKVVNKFSDGSKNAV